MIRPCARNILAARVPWWRQGRATLRFRRVQAVLLRTRGWGSRAAVVLAAARHPCRGTRRLGVARHGKRARYLCCTMCGLDLREVKIMSGSMLELAPTCATRRSLGVGVRVSHACGHRSSTCWRKTLFWRLERGSSYPLDPLAFIDFLVQVWCAELFVALH